MKTFGYVRSTHDAKGNYLFGSAGQELVPGIVHMLGANPIQLKDLVDARSIYNFWYPDAPFDILDISRQLLMGLEAGAISLVEMPEENTK